MPEFWAAAKAEGFKQQGQVEVSELQLSRWRPGGRGGFPCTVPFGCWLGTEEDRCGPGPQVDSAAIENSQPWQLLPGYGRSAQAGRLEPPEALERYLAWAGNEQAGCSESVFSVQIDASMPALKRHGSMTGFKRIIQQGQIAYRGLRFTGDNIIRNQVIAWFLAREVKPPQSAADVAVSPANHISNSTEHPTTTH